MLDPKFFVKLDKEEVIEIYEGNFFEKPHLTYKLDNKSVSVAVKLVTLNKESKMPSVFGRVYIIPSNIHELKDKDCAFSFRIGTRLLFFKGVVEIDKRGFFIDVGYGLFELKRRRHVRVEIPKDTSYTCLIITPENKNVKLETKIINISESGIRLTCNTDLALFQKNNQLIISLQVGRRAAFFIGGKIKDVNKKVKPKIELGFEFIEVTEAKKERILNICEDLGRFNIKTKPSSSETYKVP